MMALKPSEKQLLLQSPVSTSTLLIKFSSPTRNWQPWTPPSRNKTRRERREAKRNKSQQRSKARKARAVKPRPKQVQKWRGLA